MPLFLNAVTVAGNLTRNPESRQAGQSTVCRFAIAVNRKYKDREETVFLNCEAWGKTGELVQQYMAKGRNIAIEGELGFSAWEKDGQKRSEVFIRAHRVHFIGGNPQGEQRPQQQRSAGSASNNLADVDPIDDEPPF